MYLPQCFVMLPLRCSSPCRMHAYGRRRAHSCNGVDIRVRSANRFVILALETRVRNWAITLKNSMQLYINFHTNITRTNWALLWYKYHNLEFTNIRDRVVQSRRFFSVFLFLTSSFSPLSYSFTLSLSDSCCKIHPLAYVV